MELKWKPGSCAYCSGTGKIKPDLPEKVPVNTTYLATNLSGRETLRILNGNKKALARV